MAIVKPMDMDFSGDNIIMILSGLPGVGKTTLACSAPEVLVVDIDNGMKRVKTEHRRDAVMVKTYEELLEDLSSEAVKRYKTLVVDTGGALIELMKDWAVKQPSGAKKGGGISLQGFGIVKSEFNRLFRELRASHNCILLFHTLREKDREGNVIYDIQCEGATKQTVWQPVDLGAYMQIINGERYMCFTPTQEYSAKSSYGIKGMIQIPELDEKRANDCLTMMFEQVKVNMAEEAASSKKAYAEYHDVMKQGKALIDKVNSPETAMVATEGIGKLPTVLTSKTELQATLKAKLADCGLKWNKASGQYE